MKLVAKKIIKHPAVLIIIIVCFSSITSVAQQQQRPTQRSFATIMDEVKERKDARNSMLQKTQLPEDKMISKAQTANPPLSEKEAGTSLPKLPPATTRPGMLLPSQRPLKVIEKRVMKISS